MTYRVLCRTSRLAALLMIGVAGIAQPQGVMPGELRLRIDSTVSEALRSTGTPSASIAVVVDGRIAYVKAYGLANVASAIQAAPSMRYSIGSVSKQFTATAILLLAERGKLSLDDKVGRWWPELTQANEITIRQLLSMTSGYQDYWPQDYVMPLMLVPTTSRQIVDTWARKALDFPPGTRWQYSNTNYVIAGLIAERVSGMPLVDFLKQEIFTPLGMRTVFIADDGPLPPGDAVPYTRFALGPPRPAPLVGRGWLFAAGELAMTARDLAVWDMAVIDQKVLLPASYRAQQTVVLLANGTSTGYGLGVFVSTDHGRRALTHGGEVAGFTSENRVYPDERAAIVVLSNIDVNDATSRIADAIADAVFTAADGATQRAVAQTRSIVEGLEQGRIDRTLFSPNANAYFNEQAIADFKESLAPLGIPTEVVQTRNGLRGGMTFRIFRVRCGQKALRVIAYALPDGKLEQFLIYE